MPGEFYIEGKKEKVELTEIWNVVSELRSGISGMVDFWSSPVEEVRLGAAAVSLILPGVTVTGLPSGAGIVRAVAMLKFRMVENTGAMANGLSGATVPGVSQVVQVGRNGLNWADAITFTDGQFGIDGQTREGGDVCIGSLDISSIARSNGSYAFRWLLARATADFLDFNDVQVGMRLWYALQEG